MHSMGSWVLQVSVPIVFTAPKFSGLFVSLCESSAKYLSSSIHALAGKPQYVHGSRITMVSGLLF